MGLILWWSFPKESLQSTLDFTLFRERTSPTATFEILKHFSYQSSKNKISFYNYNNTIESSKTETFEDVNRQNATPSLIRASDSRFCKSGSFRVCFWKLRHFHTDPDSNRGRLPTELNQNPTHARRTHLNPGPADRVFPPVSENRRNNKLADSDASAEAKFRPN